MQLGIAILIFVAIVILLSLLFFLISCYFNRKLERALFNQHQIYSMIDEIHGTHRKMHDQEYQQFLRKRLLLKQEQGKIPTPIMMIGLAQTKNPLLNGTDDNQMKSSKRREPMTETSRSLVSMKTFKPERLDSLQESNSENGKKGQLITEYNYVNKLVAYTKGSITLLEFILISIMKEENGEITENKLSKQSKVNDYVQNFDEILEAEGFEKGVYQAYKYETRLKIPYMKKKTEYEARFFSKEEKKQKIQFLQYAQLKAKLKRE